MNPTNKLIAGSGLLTIGILGYVTLALFLHDPDAANIRGTFLFLLAPATALLTAGAAEPAIKKLNDKTSQIAEQTNGMLKRDMSSMAHDAATQAVAQHAESQTNTPAHTIIQRLKKQQPQPTVPTEVPPTGEKEVTS